MAVVLWCWSVLAELVMILASHPSICFSLRGYRPNYVDSNLCTRHLVEIPTFALPRLLAAIVMVSTSRRTVLKNVGEFPLNI